MIEIGACADAGGVGGYGGSDQNQTNEYDLHIDVSLVAVKILVGFTLGRSRLQLFAVIARDTYAASSSYSTIIAVT